MKAVEILQDWLESTINYEKTPNEGEFSLDVMDFLVKRFKNPQDSFNSIHIAGSKGKGSVSRMIASILDEYGLSVGLYNSPHILRFEERVQSAKGFFAEEIYEKSTKEIMHSVDSIIPENLPDGKEPSWFELVTLFAFLCFKNAGNDYAVLETGLGGRLDATNIVMPKISVITPIELEHTEYLGDTIEKIAGEKAGIIKEHVPVCVSVQKPEARKVFEKKAQEMSSPVYFIEDIVKNEEYSFCKLSDDGSFAMNISFDFGDFCIEGKKLLNRPVKTSLKLLGHHQLYNAALAVLAVKIIFPSMDEGIIERGLSRVSLPGRFETVSAKYHGKDVSIVLDGAHTLNSISITMDTLSKIHSDKINVLFACAKDKHVFDIARIMSEYSYLIDEVTVTKPGVIKKADIPSCKEAFTSSFDSKNVKISVDEDFEKAILDSVRKAAKENKLLLVTGSFYLVAEVKKSLLRLES